MCRKAKQYFHATVFLLHFRKESHQCALHSFPFPFLIHFLPLYSSYIILKHVLSSETYIRTVKGVCLELRQLGRSNWSLWCICMVTTSLSVFSTSRLPFLNSVRKCMVSVILLICHQCLSTLIFPVHIGHLEISLLCSLKPLSLSVLLKPLVTISLA